jgi:hypothetical protein
MIQPAPGIERVVEDEGTHVMPGVHQSFGEMGADKTIGTSNKNAPTSRHASADS